MSRLGYQIKIAISHSLIISLPETLTAELISRQWQHVLGLTVSCVESRSVFMEFAQHLALRET